MPKMWTFLAGITKINREPTVGSLLFFTHTMEITIIPRWIIKYVCANSRKQYDTNILISNLLIISVFAVLKETIIDVLNMLPHFCLMNKMLDIPCPACGITRAFCELSKGNFEQAYKLNFSSIFVAFFFLFQIPLRICSLLKHDFQKNVARISRICENMVLYVILINWVVNLIAKYL
jgi:hypothetical protein